MLDSGSTALYIAQPLPFVRTRACAQKEGAMGILTAFPHEDLAPLIDWIAERSSEKASRHRSQHSVLLWECPIWKRA